MWIDQTSFQFLRLPFRQIKWTECKKWKRNSEKFNFSLNLFSWFRLNYSRNWECFDQRCVNRPLIFLGQELSKYIYISPIQRGQTANSCCSRYLYVVTVHPSREMAIVLGTFTYSRWKVCHIAYCYSKSWTGVIFFIGLPWSRMPKMCAISQLFSDPFNPSRNKKVRVQPYCFIFLLSSFFLLGSFYF